MTACVAQFLIVDVDEVDSREAGRKAVTAFLNTSSRAAERQAFLVIIGRNRKTGFLRSMTSNNSFKLAVLQTYVSLGKILSLVYQIKNGQIQIGI